MYRDIYTNTRRSVKPRERGRLLSLDKSQTVCAYTNAYTCLISCTMCVHVCTCVSKCLFNTCTEFR